MKFGNHIDQIVFENSITVTSHTRGGRSWRKRRRIAIRPVKSAITYAIALHEIGHILGRYPRLRMDREIAAWEWAKENAVVWDDKMQKVMDRCFGSYIKKAERGKIKMTI